MSLAGERTREGPVIRPNTFKNAMAIIPSAVSIVTSWSDDGTPAGATLSAITSLSLEPALMLTCFEQSSQTLKAIKSSRRLLIHILADGQQDLAQHFSRRCNGKFDEVAWRKGLMSLPQLDGCAVTIACRLFQAVPGGDHTIIIGEIQQIELTRTTGSLAYAHRELHPLRPTPLAHCSAKAQRPDLRVNNAQ